MPEIPPIHPVEDEAWKSCIRTSDYIQAELVRTHEICMEALKDLEREEERIRSRREALAFRVCKLKSAIAPHKKLPAEVLSRIFEMTRDDPLHLPPEDPNEIKYMPVRINLNRHRPQDVCSFWRQVALQTPAIRDNIWKEIRVDHTRLCNRCSGRDFFSDMVLGLVEFAKKIIGRGTRTLVIEMGDYGGVEEGLGDADILARMSLEGSPQLEQLWISNELASQDFMELCVQMLPTFPQLNSASLALGLARQHDVRFFPLPQSPLYNLTDLEIVRHGSYDAIPPCVSVGGLCQILSCSPQLKSCDVIIANYSDLPLVSMTPIPPVLHNSLNTFYFTCNYYGEDPCGHMAPLNALTLPSLRKLNFSMDETFQGNAPLIISDFIQRSQCQLEELDLYYDRYPPAEITLENSDLLTKKLFHLKELRVPWLLTPEVLQKVASGKYLPHLVALHCSVLDEGDECCNTIAELLERRCAEPKSEFDEGNVLFTKIVS